ncbi:MAG: FprA family A-type flavoprotein [Desulfosalsimonadaceae bacterium]
MEGSDKTALLDTVDPSRAGELMAQLDGIPEIDYIISHHAEQDHSGAIPMVLERFPEAKVVATSKACGLLKDLLAISEDSLVAVKDGETLSLGDRSLKFIYTPWVHWPETMVTYLQEEGILFSCDFYGAHIATSDLFVVDQGRVYEAAKRYFAEIMLPAV